jgi:hypothetical protein
MVGSFPSFSVIYALAFLLPGFITYKLAKYFGPVVSFDDRFDKGIYTVGGSGLTLVAGLLLFHLLTLDFQIRIEGQYAPLEIGAIYVLALISSIGLGFVFGVAIDRFVHKDLDVRGPPVWDLQSENREEPARVRVVMKNGNEIWGEIYVDDSAVQGTDLILRWPQQIIRQDGEIWKRIDLDKYVYLSGEQISEIYYETELDV